MLFQKGRLKDKAEPLSVAQEIDNPIRPRPSSLKRRFVLPTPEAVCPEWDGERMCDECMEWHATK